MVLRDLPVLAESSSTALDVEWTDYNSEPELLYSGPGEIRLHVLSIVFGKQWNPDSCALFGARVYVEPCLETIN
ncbi:hypothetical protein RRG08_015543 [Elysia crispata]|uniref:Uncharacterized protein n=1 Tax=Elysia crispata TaxID=231223 RepID=A0AAE1D054_9GAST|nr:hypothetical protein RRG08_015543 [Elysia crispata]